MFVANIAPIMIVAGVGTFVQLFTVWKLGARLAKGRLLGVQLETLFTYGLYFEISKNAIDRAEELKDLFRSRGYKFFIESPTN